jgi:hypothetical protein
MKSLVLSKPLFKAHVLFFIALVLFSLSASTQTFEIESLYPDEVEICVGQTLTIIPLANPLNPDSLDPELATLDFDSAILDAIPEFSFDASNGVIVLNNPPTSGQFDIVIESSYAVDIIDSNYVVESVFATITVVINNPILGEYPNTTMAQNGNIQIAPDLVPECVQSVTAHSPDFFGDLTVDPNTGIVTVTNAKAAGIYTVMVSGYTELGIGIVNRSFQLTVAASNACSTSFNELRASLAEVNNGNAVIGDFNNDGIKDIANVIQTGVLTVLVNTQILLGDGNGGFLSSVNESPYYNLRPESHQITAGDFNGDGNLDVVGITWETAYIQYGDGLGGLTAAEDIDFPSNIDGCDYSHLNALSIGHFNDDARLDLAIAYTVCTLDNAQIRILYGAVDNVFLEGPTYNIGVNDKDPVKLIRGNFNTDELDELLVVYKKRFNYDDVDENKEICEGFQMNMAGELEPFISLNAFGVQAIATGNIDGQGTFDVAALTRNGIEIFLNGNVNNQNPNQFIPLEDAYNDIQHIDKNGDGFLDLIISSTETDKVMVLIGDGSGGFLEAISVGVENPSALTIGDFNGDAIQDCLVNNTGSSVLLGVNNSLSLNSIGDTLETELGNNQIKYIRLDNTGDTDLVIDREALTLSGSDAHLYTIIGHSDDFISEPQANFSAVFPFNLNVGQAHKYIVTLFEPEAVGTFSATLNVNKGDCVNAITSTDAIGICTSTFTGNIGAYQDVIMTSGENMSIPSSGGVFEFDKLIATTDVDFDGILSVSPNDGDLTVTNAIKPGEYIIKVSGYKQFETVGFSTEDSNPENWGIIAETNLFPMADTTFALTINDPICSPGEFEILETIEQEDVSNLTRLAIGDFNMDGEQDLITTFTNFEVSAFANFL